MLKIPGAVRKRASLTKCAAAAALALLAAGCSSAYMKSYSDTSKLAPTGAFGCVAQILTEMGYMITDSVAAEGMLKAETQKPAVMSYDGRALVYHVNVIVTQAENTNESTIEVTTNNESHARTILRTCSRKEEATEEEKQAARSALEPHHLTTGDR